MDRTIGLDVHASSCTLGVMTPSGKRIGSQVLETNARCLIEVVRQIPEPRHICLEEGTLSEWLYEVLSPHAERVVVSESRGAKDDRRDAFGLAEDLRLGAIKRKVYKKRGKWGVRVAVGMGDPEVLLDRGAQKREVPVAEQPTGPGL